MFDQLMLLVTLMADGVIIVWGLILGVILLVMANKWRYVWAMLVSLIVGVGFTELTKIAISRPRPPIEQALVYESGFSFPSGHSYFAVVFYGLITYFWVKFFKKKQHKWTVAILGMSLCLLIGVSRIYLGVHWVTDVLASFGTSSLWLGLTIIYLESKEDFLKAENRKFSTKTIWKVLWLFWGLWLMVLAGWFWMELQKF